ncbi:MAG TPA: ABC transporter permease [Bryobacteraceae bacterium]|nr:ABC transporter permease [Bryobacteraceae bacterium]
MSRLSGGKTEAPQYAKLELPATVRNMSIWQDIRIAFRLLWRTPLPTAIALLSIALSVGATAVVFAAVEAVLIRPLPYLRPKELVQFRSEFARMLQQSSGDWIVWNDTRELPQRARTIGPLGVFGNAVFDLAGDANTTPEALYGLQMNAALFPVLGVTPMLGRNVTPEEDRPGQPDVMILSFGLWVRRFHSDRAVIGRTVHVSGRDCQIIGVMPPGFNFPMRRVAAHTPSPYVEFWATPFRKSSNPIAGYDAVARLLPGVSLAAARQELAGISGDLEREFPATNRDRTIRLNLLQDRVFAGARNALLLLLGAAAFFMLIGCANVANLLLVRGVSRQSEVAVRLALGAREGRIIRQLLTESCVLALLGGIGGYVLTVAAWMILPTIAPVSIPRLTAARADSHVFEFALVLAICNGVLFGMAPALRLVRTQRGVAGLGRGGTARGHDRVRFGLIVAEVALCVVLVVTGGQLLGSFRRLLANDPGFDADRVLASVVLPSPTRYRDPQRRAAFYQNMLDALRALPGVESAGTVDALPFSGENHGGYVSRGLSSTEQPLTAEIDVVGGEYLQAMGVRLIEGRWFREEEFRAPDGNSSGPAIVSTFVAQRLWPGRSALGQLICVYCSPENPDNWRQVIGVVSNSSHIALGDTELGNVYLAAAAMQKGQFIVVRTQRPKGEMETAIRRAVAAIDPNQPVFLSAMMRDLVADSVAERRFILTLLAVTGLLALAMAAAGVYGVVAYSTSRRTQEIGIRMAVGATPGDVFLLIFRQGFGTVAFGLALGLAAALPALRALRSLLIGLEPGHSVSIAISTCVVLLAAGIACWIPARRATRTDPISALREP